jgi:hypothetical protein
MVVCLAAAIGRADAGDRWATTTFSDVSHEFLRPITLMLGPLGDVLNAPPVQCGRR